jgi:Mg-chelatase subunit ChlD
MSNEVGRRVGGAFLMVAILSGLPHGVVLGATVEGSACLAEVEPNDTLAHATTIGSERCISGTLVSVGDVDIFAWDVDEEMAATTWSLSLQGVPATVTTASLVRLDTQSDGAGSSMGAQVARIDSGAGAGTQPASTDVQLEAGRYAVVVTRQDPPTDVELTTERGYELRLVPAVEPQPMTAAPTSGTTGHIEVVTTPEGQVLSLGGGIAVEFLLDTSGSMTEPLGETTKLQVAERTMVDLVETTLPSGLPVALRTFKAEPKSCATVLRVPLQPLRPAYLTRTIGDLPIRKGTRTPIAKALSKVPSDLDGAAGHRLVVLLTDGKEDCGGDPAAAVAALVDAGYPVTLNIVGYTLGDDAQLRQELADLASLGGGRYLDAPDAAGLASALRAALAAPYLVFDAEDVLVSRGIVGDGGVDVAAGTYRVEVLADPPVTFNAVAVEAGGAVDLRVDTAG